MANTEIPEITDDIKAKCLIRTVDDDPAMREALEFMLTAEGWRVKTYENGRSFLTDDTPSTPGCAILDVRMPGMSGLSCSRKCMSEGTRFRSFSSPGTATSIWRSAPCGTARWISCRNPCGRRGFSRDSEGRDPQRE